MIFTIVNNTSNTVGPYGISGVTIPANETYVVNPPVAGFTDDANLFSDAMAGNVSIEINGNIMPFSSIAHSFQTLQLYANITGNTTKTVKSSAGILRGIIVGNNTTGGIVTIYDNTAGSGTIMVQLQIATPSGGLLSTSGLPGPLFLNTLDIEFLNGLTVVTSGSNSNNITILYQ